MFEHVFLPFLLRASTRRWRWKKQDIYVSSCCCCEKESQRVWWWWWSVSKRTLNVMWQTNSLIRDASYLRPNLLVFTQKKNQCLGKKSGKLKPRTVLLPKRCRMGESTRGLSSMCSPNHQIGTESRQWIIREKEKLKFKTAKQSSKNAMQKKANNL